MRLEELPWEGEVQDVLSYAVKTKEVPPVILLAGKDSTGVALAFLLEIFCQKGEACGQCSACQQILRGHHPDVLWLYPLTRGREQEEEEWLQKEEEAVPGEGVRKNRRNSVSPPHEVFARMLRMFRFVSMREWLVYLTREKGDPTISARRARDFLDQVVRHPVHGPWTVGVIWGAEYLGGSANILLKTLEEPPSHTRFLLLVEDIHRILPTVRSRSVILSVAPLSTSRLITFLTTHYQIDMDAVVEVVRWASGSVAEALSLLKGERAESFRVARTGWDLIRKGEDAGSWFRWLQMVESMPRALVQDILQWWIQFLAEEWKESLQKDGPPGNRNVWIQRIHHARYLIQRHLPVSLVLYMTMQGIRMQWSTSARET